MEARKIAEVEFHNEREQFRKNNPEMFEKKYSNEKFYCISSINKKYVSSLFDDCGGKRVLDYCCGLGGQALQLARRGALVTGIDISDESIKTAKEAAVKEGLENSTDFFIMDAENMEFPDNSFDYILCSGVLHHLDISKAYSELARVLRPNGKVIAVEGLAHNPVINLYRRLTPHLRTKWETEHILTIDQIKLAKQYFNIVDVKFFHLVTIAAVPFRNTVLFKGLLRILAMIDSIILRIPGIRLLAWMTVFNCSAPKN